MAKCGSHTWASIVHDKHNWSAFRCSRARSVGPTSEGWDGGSGVSYGSPPRPLGEVLRLSWVWDAFLLSGLGALWRYWMTLAIDAWRVGGARISFLAHHTPPRVLPPIKIDLGGCSLVGKFVPPWVPTGLPPAFPKTQEWEPSAGIWTFGVDFPVEAGSQASGPG